MNLNLGIRIDLAFCQRPSPDTYPSPRHATPSHHDANPQLKRDDVVLLDVRLPASYPNISLYEADRRNSIPDFTRQVTIIINEDNPELTAVFTVAECLLTETSKYFEKECSGNWQGSKSRTLRLLDVDVDAFNSYVCWANRKALAIDFDFTCGCGEEDHPYAVAKFVTLWLLADRLADTKLRNAVMDAIVDLQANWGAVDDEELLLLFPPRMTVSIWSTLAKGRALRRLLIDHYTENVTTEVMKPHWDECHPDLIKSLAMEGAVPSKAKRRMTRRRATSSSTMNTSIPGRLAVNMPRKRR